jgi:polar amino acid transport system substrate-binding protein
MHTFFRPLCLLIAVTAMPVQAEHIVMAGDPWCPYTCEADAAQQGYLVDLAREILSSHGHTLEYKVLPWSRAIEEARRGDVAGIIGAYTEDAPEFFFPAVQQSMVLDTFFVLKDKDWRYSGEESLLSQRVGIIKDYAYSDEFLAYLEKYANDGTKIEEADGEEALHTNIRKLLRARIDVIPEVAAVFWYHAAQLDVTDKFKPAGTSGQLKPLYIAFAPSNPKAEEYARLISEGTQRLRASGELAKILSQYSLKDQEAQ